VDNLNLAYDQYHADEQIGSCSNPPAVAALDQLIYLECPNNGLGVSVLDGSAAGSVRVTVTSLDGGDSETFSIYGTGPYFVTTLPYSTAGGPRSNDGTLFVLPSDVVTLTYDESTVTSTAVSYINCEGGNVVVAGVAGLSDNGDGDEYADTNETVDISIRIQNNTDQPLQNVTVTIATDDPAVDCILKDTASFGTIDSAGATGTNDLGTDPFTFKVSNQATCVDPITPPTATFEVLILADGFAGPVTPQRLTMVLDMNDLPGTITFTEDFNADPPGFYHELGPGDDNGISTGPGGLACSPYVDEFFWSATGGNSGGGYFCWQDPADAFPSGTYSDLNDSALYSPVFKIGATSTTLSFDHEYQFAWSGTYRVDGARVDYRVNGGVWQKVTALPYDGDLIWNSYCNPLCNGTEFGLPCFSENPGEGEQIFNQLDQGTVSWTTAAADITGLNTDDLVQLRWRVGSMNTSAYGISTDGGYGLDNVSLSNVIEQECDTAVHPDTGCGVIYDEYGNLVELCGDGDLVVEPTELWSIDVTLRNSASTDATNTTADLVVSGGTPVLANVTNNPGSFGTIAANGGTATASYEFSVDPGGVCINDILFDVNDIVDDGATYKDEPSAFAVPIGGVSAQETSTQSVDPIDASNDSAASSLLPALTIPNPAYTVTVDYSASYTNVAPEEVGVQSTDPLTVENGATLTLLNPAAEGDRLYESLPAHTERRELHAEGGRGSAGKPVRHLVRLFVPQRWPRAVPDRARGGRERSVQERGDSHWRDPDDNRTVQCRKLDVEHPGGIVGRHDRARLEGLRRRGQQAPRRHGDLQRGRTRCLRATPRRERQRWRGHPERRDDHRRGDRMRSRLLQLRSARSPARRWKLRIAADPRQGGRA